MSSHSSWSPTVSASVPPLRACLVTTSASTHFPLPPQLLAYGVRDPHPLLLVERVAYAVGEGRHLDERPAQRDRRDPGGGHVVVLASAESLGDVGDHGDVAVFALSAFGTVVLG